MTSIGVLPRHARGWQFTAWALCVLGAAWRIAAYAQHRSLWYDEAALALNIAGRGFVELVEPLDYLQTAPPLFLWIERSIVLLFGANEWALRALPLAAGMVTAPLMWRVASRILPSPAAVLAVALVALSPALVRYSAEVKPYATDALVTLLVLDSAVQVAVDPLRSGRWRALGLVGMAAIVASTPSVFILAGVTAYLTTDALVSRDARSARRTASLAAGWAGLFLVLLATVFRPLLGDTAPIGKFMHWYWAANFLTTEPPGIAAKVSALLWAAFTNTFLGEGAFSGATSVLLLATVVGLAALIASRNVPLATLLTVPAIALAAASMLRRYPIAERVILFAAPLTALLIAASQIPLSHRRLRSLSPILGGAITAAVVALAGRGDLARFRSDVGRQESRDLVRSAVRKHAAGDPVWISGGGEAAWRFYSAAFAARESRREADATTSFGGRALAADVLVGAWFDAPPEQILTMSDDTAAASKPSRWSDTEAMRVRSLARPCALLFLSHMQPGEVPALLASVTQAGGQLRESRREPGAELHDVCFERPA